MQITKVGTGYLVNGVNIVKPDVITMNGVVHYVKKVSFSLFELRGGAVGWKLTPGRSLTPIMAHSHLQVHLRHRRLVLAK